MLFVEESAMYGLLLGSFADAIKDTYGDEVWRQIREKAGVQYATFVNHTVRIKNLN